MIVQLLVLCIVAIETSIQIHVTVSSVGSTGFWVGVFVTGVSDRLGKVS